MKTQFLGEVLAVGCCLGDLPCWVSVLLLSRQSSPSLFLQTSFCSSVIKPPSFVLSVIVGVHIFGLRCSANVVTFKYVFMIDA